MNVMPFPPLSCIIHAPLLMAIVLCQDTTDDHDTHISPDLRNQNHHSSLAIFAAFQLPSSCNAAFHEKNLHEAFVSASIQSNLIVFP
mmetsp:Transcript_36259/g.61833  ORF Transcript_36259/g.61833 Transcript_36259/m.61833 type:complete len:87 (-) Transcript_36259:363-623(-)